MKATFLDDRLTFLRGLIARPGNVGAIAPSSEALARAVAEQADPLQPGPVLELGPGTGVVTEALIARGFAPERIVAIEYDRNLAALVSRHCPGVRVIRGDAFDLERTLGANAGAPFAACISGLPLLNQPMARRRKLMADAFALLAPGAPFIQFSYGLRPPVPAGTGLIVTRAARVLANLPPATVWRYRRVPV
ncbi:MAG TPA: methyltransferase domain-containing protein [Rhizomicrobium sp.]